MCIGKVVPQALVETLAHFYTISGKDGKKERRRRKERKIFIEQTLSAEYFIYKNSLHSSTKFIKKEPQKWLKE